MNVYAQRKMDAETNFVVGERVKMKPTTLLDDTGYSTVLQRTQ